MPQNILSFPSKESQVKKSILLIQKKRKKKKKERKEIGGQGYFDVQIMSVVCPGHSWSRIICDTCECSMTTWKVTHRSTTHAPFIDVTISRYLKWREWEAYERKSYSTSHSKRKKAGCEAWFPGLCLTTVMINDVFHLSLGLSLVEQL